MRSDAQKRADERYKAKVYKKLQVNIKIPDFEIIDNYCKDMEISKAQFVCSACKYFVKLGELPPED